MTRYSAIVVATAVLILVSSDAPAQPLGTFRWQLQPFCNVVTVTVTQQAGLYTIDGTDDLCGAPQRAGVTGMAFPNPDGTIGFGLTIVDAPGAVGVHVHAAINLTTLSGTWRDSAGNLGTFTFTPATGTGGSLRPVPPGGLAAGSVTAVQLAAGAVGAAQLGANAVGGANVANGSLTIADQADAPRVASSSGDQFLDLPGGSTPVVVRAVTIVVPASGTVLTSASGYVIAFRTDATLEEALCTLTPTTDIDFTHLFAFRDGSNTSNNFIIPFGATRAFPVAAGSQTFNLVCSGNARLADTVVTAVFIAG